MTSNVQVFGSAIAIRQEDLEIIHQETNNSFPAQINSWQYAGSRLLVNCEVQNKNSNSKTIIFVETDRFADFSVSKNIFIAYDPSRLHVIPRGE